MSLLPVRLQHGLDSHWLYIRKLGIELPWNETDFFISRPPGENSHEPLKPRLGECGVTRNLRGQFGQLALLQFVDRIVKNFKFRPYTFKLDKIGTCTADAYPWCFRPS